ncbi:MAG: TonB-dependent receptor plug domain-containing protein, partial [Pseudomonadota bacterium]
MNQYKLSVIALAMASVYSNGVYAEDAEAEVEIEEIVTVGQRLTYANNMTNESMVEQQSTLTSVLAVIDNLPGVLINEGDPFGADDWSTSINIRGFQTDLGQQQIGITIDGIANGNSNYGGGAKANRYIDTENLGVVSVAQGTSDITSRSNEALGGTINFTTIDPTDEHSVLASLTLAEFDGQKFFVRLNTGEIFDDTYAWISVSSQESSDWMDQAAQNSRDHFAAKIKSYQGDVELTGYFAYDDTHEDNYQRIYGLTQFEQNDEWDQLTDTRSGIPYVDQAFRRGWSTLRENIFGYLQADWEISDNSTLSANVYYHDNEGRGDWLPPYIVDVTDDGAGNPNSELLPQTVSGGLSLGQIYFVDAAGVALTPEAGCVSSLTFPYGGGRAEYDPACYPEDAIPVGSYRHTHYEKERIGFNFDYEWMTQIGDFDNTVRAGFWYEDYERREFRDWHRILDSRTSFRFDQTA